MKHLSKILALSLLGLLSLSAEKIFDGESLSGWSGTQGVWKLKDGAITAEIKAGQTLSKNEYLFYKEELEDFILELEYKITGGPTANSGIQYRSKKDGDGAKGYQADIDDGKEWLGRIYDEHGRALITERGHLVTINKSGKRDAFPFRNASELGKLAKKDDWNSYKIIARGHRTEIHINGVHFSTLEDYQEGEFDLKGLLALQLHSGAGPAKVQFRNINLTKLKAAPATNGEASPKESPVLMHLSKNPKDTNPQATTTNNMFVPAGFKVETIASEPLLRQPIAFTFDYKGRIWIAEAYAYPRRAPEGQGKDRLVILEDKDGDGKYETHKIFADNLNLISGFEIGYGGVFVGTAPTLAFIPDKNADDKPDGPPEVLLDGWDTRDTHETPNSFMWGHDGWLYGTHGLYNNSFVGKPGTPRNERLKVNAAVWRYHPIKKEFEVYAQGGSNQWGLDMNADGAMFMTHCRSAWGLGPVTQVFRDGHYWSQENRDHFDFIATHRRGYVRRETPLNNMMRGVAAYGHGEGGAGGRGSRGVFGGHSHVGTMIYLGHNWPKEYQGNLFTNNLHGKQMNRHLVQNEDSGYLSHPHGREQLFSADSRYLGVDLKYGPDGAVYIIDWYDQQQCHTNNVERWDRTNGRLYRMQYEATFKPRKTPNFKKASNKNLIQSLSHRNEWYARQAQHELRQRAVRGAVDRSTISYLRKFLFSSKNEYKFRTLVALYAVNGIDTTTYKKLFRSKDEVLRSQALHFLTEQAPEKSLKFASEILRLAYKDPSPTVRLTLAGATQRRLDKKLAKKVISVLAMKKEDVNDRFIAKMLWYGFAQFAKDDFKTAFSLADKSPLPEFRRSVYWYATKHNTNLFASKILSANNDQFEDYLNLLQQQYFVEDKKEQRTPPDSWSSIQARVSSINKPTLNEIRDKIVGYIDPSKAKKETLKERIARGRQAFAICKACHVSKKDQPGPSLQEISKVYKNKADIIKWIKKPGKKRANYPAMPGFPHMPESDLDAIAEYLLFLGKK